MSRAKPGRGPREPRAEAYAALSAGPLHVLAFLLPLVVFYEAGMTWVLADRAGGAVETIRAHSILLGLFQEAGAAGRFLPALAVVAVLAAQQVIRGASWRVRPVVLAGMSLECVMWTAPLFVFGAIIHRAAAGLAGVDWSVMPWAARLTIAVGAGLYEEFLFRLVGIAAVHFLLVDVLRRSDDTGRWVAVTVTAIAFALYHEVATRGGRLDWALLAMFTAAGLYLGWLFLSRGFAIVVGVHALYDALVLVAIPALQAPRA